MTDSAFLYMTQVRFCRALAVVRSLPTSSGGSFQPSIGDKLNFYGLYKQAVVGDIMLLKPSSRMVVQYAKWKAWDRLRGVRPIDAQKMYIDALIQLLDKFLVCYPDSELGESLVQSLVYLQETDETVMDEENMVEWDTNEQEKEEYHLGNIEKNQIIREHQSSYQSSPVTSEFPLTPDSSPRYRSGISYKHSYSMQSYPNNEDVDYIDHEVATTTSSLYLSTPSQHPYGHSQSPTNALYSLQQEVAMLYTELNSLKQNNHGNKLRLKWSWLLSIKSIAKHTAFNLFIMSLLLIVLWRRKSPIAYAILGFKQPRYKNLIQFLFHRVMFWKVTV